MTKKTTERDETIEELRKLLPPGTTVRPVLRNVSRSGMSRRIDFYRFIPKDNGRGGVETYYLTGLIAKALGYTFPQRGEGIRVDGCGMDMGFHVVYSLGRTLFADGWACTGENCPSNAHSNGEARRKGKMHKGDGGYALRSEWL